MSLDAAAGSPSALPRWTSGFKGFLADRFSNCLGSPRNWLDARRADGHGTDWERK